MAARFDASTDLYSATTGLPAGTAWTATCWAYITTDRNAFSGAVGIANSGVTDGVAIETGVDGTTWGAFDAATSVGAVAATVGAWTRLAVAVNGTAVTFYGAAAGSALTSASGTLTGGGVTPGRLTIGDDGFGGWLNGRVAAVKLWAATLTLAEIENELGQYLPVRTANLTRRHPLLTAETVDHSGNGNALTAGGTAAATEDGPPIPWAALSPIAVS